MMTSLWKHITNIFSPSPPQRPPSAINITITPSSSILHKYGSDNDVPFTLTLEATLPENSPDKPVTIFTFDTLLRKKGKVLFEEGLQFIDTETGIPAKRPSVCLYYELSSSEYPITREYGSNFVTLEPGVPYQVTHEITPLSPILRPSSSPSRVDIEARPITGVKSASGPGSEAMDDEKSKELRQDHADEATVAVDMAVLLSTFAHTGHFQVGSTYRVELGSRMSEIAWYRYGAKDEILSCDDSSDTMKRPERVGDQKGLRPIPLVLRSMPAFKVVE
ncbi:hypothetical protein BBP40_007642 [Aspergillus hancockii]|nr:hypothetical protein BBP40_007642 [Aspergillus hancockii]